MPGENIEEAQVDFKGVLYCIPVPISGVVETIPVQTISIIHQLRHFVVENARTARRFISSTKPPYKIDELVIVEIDKHGENDFKLLSEPLARGIDIGLMSEAGCPGIADPGAELVGQAHRLDCAVVPLSGPSSILMSLMASGLVSQKFAFHGYLPRKRGSLIQELKRLERQSAKDRSIQVFIETPYRNNQMFEAILGATDGRTQLSIAVDISGQTEFIRTKTVSDWKNSERPDLHKRPAVFAIMA